MKSRARFTQEQRKALLKGYITSNLRAREYAELNCVGFSTLAKWAREEGVSLSHKKKKPLTNFQEETSGLKDKQQNSCRIPNEVFSFIDMTGYVKEAPFEPRVISPRTSEPLGSSSSSPSCGIEIRLPNGITIRIDQASTHEFWSQVIGFARAFS